MEVIDIFPYIVGESNYGYAVSPESKWKKRMIENYGKRIKNILDNREYLSIGEAARYYDIRTNL